MPSGMLWIAIATTIGRATSGGDERGHAFGEVMDADSEGEHHGRAAHVVAVGGFRELAGRVHFVGVFIFRYEVVDQCDQGDAAEEGE